MRRAQESGLRGLRTRRVRVGSVRLSRTCRCVAARACGGRSASERAAAGLLLPRMLTSASLVELVPALAALPARLEEISVATPASSRPRSRVRVVMVAPDIGDAAGACVGPALCAVQCTLVCWMHARCGSTCYLCCSSSGGLQHRTARRTASQTWALSLRQEVCCLALRAPLCVAQRVHWRVRRRGSIPRSLPALVGRPGGASGTRHSSARPRRPRRRVTTASQCPQRRTAPAALLSSQHEATGRGWLLRTARAVLNRAMVR